MTPNHLYDFAINTGELYQQHCRMALEGADPRIWELHVRVNVRVDSTPMKVNLYCSNTAPGVNPQMDKVTAVLNCLDFYSVSASVWDKDELWLLGRDKLGTARESAKDLVDAFLVDLLRANEKALK